jgi:hypothetical protein
MSLRRRRRTRLFSTPFLTHSRTSFLSSPHRHVLAEYGPRGERQLVELEQEGRFQLLWYSGSFPTRVFVDQDAATCSMK